MGTTIRDVAREAGVSVATVSRVLNGSAPVKDETRSRVETIARRLRYTPNLAAQSLNTRRTTTIGVLLPDLFGEFFSEVIRGIDQTAQQRGYHVLLSSSHNDRAAIEATLRAMRGRVDGLLVMSPDLDTHSLSQNLPEQLPAVLLGCRIDDLSYDSITIDNYGGARAMTAHLARLGHRRIALIKGDERNRDSLERLRGYRDALSEAGADWDPVLEIAGTFTEESGVHAAEAALRLREPPTAIFASNDAMAIGVLSALRAAGVRVPEEVAVTGFDDIPMAQYVHPPLTTVRVQIHGLGAHATTRLINAIEAGSAEGRKQITLPARLVVRGSCGGAGR